MCAHTSSSSRAVGVAVHPDGQLGVERGGDAVALVAAAGEEIGAGEEPGRVVSRALARGVADELGPFEQLAGDILIGLGLLPQLARPRSEGIDPGLHRILVTSLRADDEPAAPCVVDQRGQRRFLPARGVRLPVAKHGADDVVPFGENVRRHDHFVPDRSLDREPPAVNLGRHRLDDDARRGMLSVRNDLRTP